MKTPQQGAATSVLLAASALLDGIGGRYFEDCNEALLLTRRSPDWIGVAPYPLNPDNARRLWEVSTELLDTAATIREVTPIAHPARTQARPELVWTTG